MRGHAQRGVPDMRGHGQLLVSSMRRHGQRFSPDAELPSSRGHGQRLVSSMRGRGQRCSHAARLSGLRGGHGPADGAGTPAQVSATFPEVRRWRSLLNVAICLYMPDDVTVNLFGSVTSAPANWTARYALRLWRDRPERGHTCMISHRRMCRPLTATPRWVARPLCTYRRAGSSLYDPAPCGVTCLS